MPTRRHFLAGTISTLVLARTRPVLAARRRRAMLLGFGTYGTRDLSTEEAIRLIADRGYDAIELTVNAGWDASPERMSPDRRKKIRELLAESGLELTSLRERINPSADDTQEQKNLDRLRRSAELGRQLGGGHPPQIQTVLGGGSWEERRQMFVDRLGAWAELAREAGTVVSIKPHRGGAMSRPSQAVWIFEQLGNPRWLRMVYDFSHYIFRDMQLEETIRQSARYTNQVVVKDTVRTADGGTTFVLPGESGNIDYPQLLRLFHRHGYRGDVSCEVSSAVWRQEGYDPRAAVQTCYRNMSAAFQAAGLRR
ncbi:MAG: sugar phosphate isomerase/epimerase family protein [Pirellulaceae bacterium]|nr:sugar phosphate isomerase/epimerase family protein [Pirellulaceae bacterium]